MDIKFGKNDTVVYGNNGICIVEDIKTMKFGTENAVYYVLKPKSNKASTLYVPLDKKILVSKMRRVLTRAEIDDILESDTQELVWPENKAERSSLFSGIISRCDTRELLMMIKCIYLKKEEKRSLGKALSTSDDNTLKTAEKLIDEEFSFSLNCSNEEVKDYIKSKINNR